MRRFVLNRVEDETGISGTGLVAEGVHFTDGTAVMRWATEVTSFGFYDSMDSLIKIHGHNGKTKIIWIDNGIQLYD